MIKLLNKIYLGEKKDGVFKARNSDEIEDMAYLHRLGYVNKFDLINGCAATLTSKGTQELKRLQNA